MRVVGVFVKLPVAGVVKTRLAAGSSAEWAAEVATALLADTLARMQRVEARRVIAFAPDDAADWFKGRAPAGYELLAQAEGDLGRRLQHFFLRQIECGAQATVVIGTDSPTLPIDYVQAAFDRLGSADLVLGPACDGGYYLIGCGRRLAPVFDGIVWSSATLLDDTVRRLEDPSWRLAVLPPWYDVDTPQDWQLLCGHVRALRRAGIDPAVPRLEALMP
jgi:rSAM/selenodomain-associated transferase 1